MTEIREADVGLGSAYERIAVYALLDRWFGGAGIGSALEGPVDGMAGMAGLHLIGLARRGLRVTVALPDDTSLDIVRRTYRALGIEDRLTTLRLADPAEAAGAGPFDLVLTYNALPVVADWRDYLRRLAPLARRELVVAVTNPDSYGVILRRLQRRLEPHRAPELFDHPSTRVHDLVPVLAQLGLIQDRAFVDCPWWPDFVVPTAESLRRGMPAGLGLLKGNITSRHARFRYTPENFPLFAGQPGHEELNRALARHPVFEGRGRWLGRAFGHLHAFRIKVERAGLVGVG